MYLEHLVPRWMPGAKLDVSSIGSTVVITAFLFFKFIYVLIYLVVLGSSYSALALQLWGTGLLVAAHRLRGMWALSYCTGD